jgi:hypothetical protein
MFLSSRATFRDREARAVLAVATHWPVLSHPCSTAPFLATTHCIRITNQFIIRQKILKALQIADRSALVPMQDH